MKQFSTDDLPVELELISGHLLFVDPLYFQEIIDQRSQVDMAYLHDKREFVKALEETLFPYGNGGLLGYKAIDQSSGNYTFNPSSLKKWDDDNIELKQLAQQKQITTFGLDTDSLLIIDLGNFERLVWLITYDTLIDSLLANQIDKYFDHVNRELGNKGWAYVVSKGVDTNTEFDGDGLYLVE